MSDKAAVTVSLQPGGTVATREPQKSFPFVLKKIMDIPPPNILEEGDDGKGRMREGALRFPVGFRHVLSTPFTFTRLNVHRSRSNISDHIVSF